MENIYEEVKPFLTEAGKKTIEEKGQYVYNEKHKEFATPLIEGAACAYITYEANGIAKCGIEKAYEAGKIDFKKNDCKECRLVDVNKILRSVIER